MAGTNSRLLPTIVNNFFSSSGFRNAVGLFITKQQAENLAKEEAERVFCTLNESEKESIRNTLPKQELTVVKLLSAALELLTEYNQPYFTSNLSKANATCKEYTDISLRVAITLDPGHPIIRRKNSNQSKQLDITTMFKINVTLNLYFNLLKTTLDKFLSKCRTLSRCCLKLYHSIRCLI